MGTCSKPITVQISSGEHIPKRTKSNAGKRKRRTGKGKQQSGTLKHSNSRTLQYHRTHTRLALSARSWGEQERARARERTLGENAILNYFI